MSLIKNVFMQLLANQKFILFADDPLSGLDSISSYLLVKTLQRLAKNGFTILCTLDQPSSDVYALFNKYVIGIRDSALDNCVVMVQIIYWQHARLDVSHVPNHTQNILQFSTLPPQDCENRACPSPSLSHNLYICDFTSYFLLRTILLAEGRVTYLGPSNEAVSYFGRYARYFCYSEVKQCLSVQF